jgi:malonate-semialdehyde dehydrogenase (acetylating)/methylmalonate-semialdehyde dehydrogenase
VSASFVKIPQRPLQSDHWIGGEMCPPSSGKYLDVKSPYNAAVIGQVALGNKNDVEKAVAAAKKAFPAWRATPAKERAQLLFKFRELVLANLDELAHLAAAESGKTLSEARAEVLKGVEVTEFALSLQNSDSGGIMDVSRGVSCELRREPLGVVAGIVPFNFPAMVPMWMYPIAIALGNCFVLKPSEKVPLTSQRIAALTREAGFPPGVFSLLNGTRDAVEALIDHPDVKAVGFVGSSPVALDVYRRATSLGKRALCLGGAKNHLIVVPDADEAITVRGVLDSFTGCAGQRCMAAAVMVAVGNVDHLIEKIRKAAAELPYGAEAGSSMGAIIDKAALERIRRHVDEAEKSGAKIIVDGRKVKAPHGHEAGNWFGPTVIDHANPDMACAREEIFGPVLTIVRVKTLAEALAFEANNPYGNATSVFTTSGAVARHVADQATSGMIGVNIGVPVPREPFSFGGTKASKYGHSDITGESSLDFWSNLKKVTTKWSLQSDASWMS